MDDIVRQFIPQEDDLDDNALTPKWPFRMIINAPSGGGKTNMVMSLTMKYLKFDRLYIFTPDLSEPKYQVMINWFQACERKYEKINGEEIQCIWFGEDAKSIPKLNDLDKNYRNLIILDDLILDKNANMFSNELFIRGRKRNASIIYQSQSFFAIPKNIRNQANYFVLFGVNSEREMRSIASHYGSGVDYKEFIQLFREATNEKFSFMVIDKVTSEPYLKFRKKWDGLLNVDD